MGTVAWTASKTASWLSLSASSGTLPAGATTTVTASLNATANTLASGNFTDTVTFTNTTNGTGNTTRPATLTITPVGDLTVTPATNLDATGPVGGPFTPASRAYLITNSGDAALNWTAAKTAPWLTLSATLGTLAPGTNATITASIAATTLEAGSYNDTVIFTNTTTGRGNTARAVALSVILPAPGLVAEPPFTGGTSNTVSWSAVSVAGNYEVETATDAAFTSPVSSGWIAGTTRTFAGLTDGRLYFYRVRARRVVAGPLEAWAQTSQADFQTGTALNLDLTSSGSVLLAAGNTIWSENFDEAGTSWNNTIFSLQTSGAAGVYVRKALDATQGAPLTTPALPINQGGDLEGRFAPPSPNGSSRIIMPATAANIMTDGSMEGFLAHGIVGTVGSHYGSFLLRTSADGLNGYSATIGRGSATSGTVSITKWTNGIGGAALASGSFTAAFGSECYRLRFAATGSTLTASAWIVRVAGGVIQETPVTFTGGSTTLTVIDSSYPSGVAGLYCFGSATNSVFLDDITVTKFGGVAHTANGSLTSPAITPAIWNRWNNLSFGRDTSAAGTALTVDVLDAGGALLAANVASGTDLNAIPAVAVQPSIRLRANLSTTNSANTPRLESWLVYYFTVPAQTAISDWSNFVSSIQDATAPILTVTSPATAGTVQPAILGTATDAGGVSSVLVNGVAASSSDGFAHWSAAIPLSIGVNNLSIVARDNAVPANVRTVTHTVTVTPAAGDADGDGLPDAWEALYGLSTTDGTGPAGAFGDPDKDGRVSVLELALGSNPVVPDSGGIASPALVLDTYDGKTYLTWHYRRLLAPGALSYVAETTTDLNTWHSGPGWVEEVGAAVPVGDGLTETVTIRALPEVTAGSATRHLRLRITLP